MGPGLFSLQTAFTYLVKTLEFLAHFTPCKTNLICFISRNFLEKKFVLAEAGLKNQVQNFPDSVFFG